MWRMAPNIKTMVKASWGENRRKEYVSISGETKYVEKGINRENL